MYIQMMVYLLGLSAGVNEPPFDEGVATHPPVDTQQLPPPSSSAEAPPIGTSQPPTQQGGTNPYRLGGVGKKAAQYSTPATYAAPISQPFVPQPLVGAPPSMSGVPSLTVGSTPPTVGAFPPATSKGAPGQPPLPHYSQPPPPYTTAPVTAARQPFFQQADSVPGHVMPGMGSEPVKPHWFYLRAEEKYWFPFSLVDSVRLEEALLRNGQEMNNSEVMRSCVVG